MLVSYLIVKPRGMIESVFYWQEVLEVSVDSLLTLRKIKNAEFFVGKAEEVLPEFYEKLKEAGYADK